MLHAVGWCFNYQDLEAQWAWQSAQLMSGPWIEPHRRHCFVSFSKVFHPHCLVLVQLRKTTGHDLKNTFDWDVKHQIRVHCVWIHKWTVLSISYSLTSWTFLVPGSVAQSVKCLVTDGSLTADPVVPSLIPARSHTFLEIDHEITPPFR